MFLYLPGKAVRVGESWTKENNADFGVVCLKKDTWTLKEVRPDAIVLVGELELGPSSPVGASSPIDAIGISGTGTSNLEIDPATGWIKSSRTTTETSGTVSNPQGQGKTQKMKLKGTSTNVTVVTRKK